MGNDFDLVSNAPDIDLSNWIVFERYDGSLLVTGSPIDVTSYV